MLQRLIGPGAQTGAPEAFATRWSMVSRLGAAPGNEAGLSHAGPHRSCHSRATSEGQSRCTADSHGQSRRPHSRTSLARPAGTHPANVPDKDEVPGSADYLNTSFRAAGSPRAVVTAQMGVRIAAPTAVTTSDRVSTSATVVITATASTSARAKVRPRQVGLNSPRLLVPRQINKRPTLARTSVPTNSHRCALSSMPRTWPRLMICSAARAQSQ